MIIGALTLRSLDAFIATVAWPWILRMPGGLTLYVCFWSVPTFTPPDVLLKITLPADALISMSPSPVSIVALFCDASRTILFFFVESTMISFSLPS